MPDEQTDPDQGESPTVSSVQGQEAIGRNDADGTATRANDETAPSEVPAESASVEQHPLKRSAPRGPGCFKLGCVTLVLLLVTVGGFLYIVAAGLDPSLGPGNAGARSVAKAAVTSLSKNPSVESTQIMQAGANSNTGSVAEVKAHLKADTPVDSAADMLPSTCSAAQRNSVWGTVTVGIIFTWNMKGTEIDVYFNCRGPASELRTGVQHDLAPAGEAATIMRNDDTSSLEVDYADVTTPPSTLTATSGSPTIKTFTMNGWKVTSTSNTDGQFSNPPFDQLITAAKQASPAGTIDLDGTTLSVTGLVTDERKGLTPEAAAPVIHTVADCQAAGLTTLQLNNWTLNTTSNVADPWLAFTCNNGTWTPTHESTRGQDEAAILNKAAEL
ncbi:hypothetical protein [Actinomyces oris]|uniref:hypothetical protein n=1 Tax=Actinomyces oris TaxID=544580 RepID=UPI00242A6C1F|nr:hypothetical protein [Actinomyces oris]